MTTDEAEHTRRGAEILVAELSGDSATVALLASEVDEVVQLADGLVLVAIAAGTMAADLEALSLRAVLEGLPRFEVRLFPEASSDWRVALDLVVARAEGDRLLLERSMVGLEVPVVVNSAFEVALSASATVAKRVGRHTLDLLQEFITAAEQEMSG